MPYVDIKITRESVTTEQKLAVIAGVTEVLVRVLHKDPETTFVVIQEVELEDWGIGGTNVREWRKKKADERDR